MPGLIATKSEGYWGFANKRGEITIPPRYDRTTLGFREGYVGVGLKDKWGFINTRGEPIREFCFSHTALFSEGYGIVGLGGSWDSSGEIVGSKSGYINTRGEVIIKPQYDYAYPFNDGIARVDVGEWPNIKTGYINTAGEFVWVPSS